MARKAKLAARRASALPPEPALLRAVKRSSSPLLDVRPPGALTTQELAQRAGVGRDVIRRRLQELEQQDRLRGARVRLPKGSYTIVYWIDEE